MRVKIIRKLGEGSCANVYLVDTDADVVQHDASQGDGIKRYAVLKQPKPGYEEISGYEAVELHNISKHGGHPNIVRVHLFLHNQPVEEVIAEHRMMRNQSKRQISKVPHSPQQQQQQRLQSSQRGRPANGLSLILEYCDGGSLNQFLDAHLHSCVRFSLPISKDDNLPAASNARIVAGQSLETVEGSVDVRSKRLPISYADHARHLFYPFVFCAAGEANSETPSSAGPLSSSLLVSSPHFSPVIPLTRVRQFMAELVDAVTFLRSLRQWHRDVKPANILLTSKDISIASVKLADFGFARRTGKMEKGKLLSRAGLDAHGSRSKKKRSHLSATASRVGSSREGLKLSGASRGAMVSMLSSQTVSLTSRSQWSTETQSDGLFTSSGGKGTQGYMAPERLRCFLRDVGSLEHIERDLAREYGNHNVFQGTFKANVAPLDGGACEESPQGAASAPFMYSRGQSEVWSLGMVLWEMIYGTILIGMLSCVRELVEAHRFVEEHVDHVVSCTLDAAGKHYTQRGMETESADCRAAALLLRTMLRTDPDRRVTLAALHKSSWLRKVLRGDESVPAKNDSNDEHEADPPEVVPDSIPVESVAEPPREDLAEPQMCEKEEATTTHAIEEDQGIQEETGKDEERDEVDSDEGSFGSLAMSLSSWEMIDSPTSGFDDEYEDLMYPIGAKHDASNEKEASDSQSTMPMSAAPPSTPAPRSWFSRLFSRWGGGDYYHEAATHGLLPNGGEGGKGNGANSGEHGMDSRPGVLSTQSSEGVLATLISYLRLLWRQGKDTPAPSTSQ